MSRKIASIAVACLLACGSVSAQENTEANASQQLTSELKNRVIVGSVGDSVSTYIALHNGGVESNPLINTSVGGLVALAGLKIGITELINRSDMPQADKQHINNNISALYLGVTVNNLLVAASATPAGSLAGGLIAGYMFWKNGSDKIEALNHPLSTEASVASDSRVRVIHIHHEAE